MYNNSNIKSLINKQVPDFIREDSPKFVAFLQAYYEWMSLSQITLCDPSLFQKGDTIIGLDTGASGIIKGLNETTGVAYVKTTTTKHFKQTENIALSGDHNIFCPIKSYKLNPLLSSEKSMQFTDIDNTIDLFIESFYKEIAIDFPRNTSLSDEKVLKNIKNFYESKGTIDSFRYLFRILFQEEIEFKFPRESVLRPSDNNYQNRFIIKTATNCSSLEGFEIIGRSSLATAVVEEVIETKVFGTTIFNIYLNRFSLRGEFASGEYIKINDNNITQSFELLPNDNIKLISSANNFNIDEVITIEDYNRRIQITVTDSDKGPIESFYIQNGGSGYMFGDKIDISEILPSGVSHDPNYYPARAFVSGVDGSGKITDIQITNPGNNFKFLHLKDSVQITSAGGAGAILIPIGSNIGRIKTFKIKTITALGGVDEQDLYSYVFSKNSNYDTVVQADILNDSDYVEYFDPVTLTLSKSAFALDYPFFENTKSFLSSDQKVQDSNYYQDFSYVIISNIPVSGYKDVIKKLVHTAGTKLFGEIEIVSSTQLGINIITDIGGSGNIADSADFVDEYRKTILEIIKVLDCTILNHYDDVIENYRFMTIEQMCQGLGLQVTAETDSTQTMEHNMPLLEAYYKGNNNNYRFERRIEDSEKIVSTVQPVELYDIRYKREPFTKRKTISQFIAENTYISGNQKIRPTINFLTEQVYPRNVKKRIEHLHDSFIFEAAVVETE